MLHDAAFPTPLGSMELISSKLGLSAFVLTAELPKTTLLESSFRYTAAAFAVRAQAVTKNQRTTLLIQYNCEDGIRATTRIWFTSRHVCRVLFG
ncbi:hypothetical protein BSZ32_01015 [Rubritalea profundi]|uniref:Uncharacterized protein n=1 Tax=Rubritalea profundi TaxID=1658618 RepID=A0A2S7TYL8_9BACT|nr:hypothetical protein BSZ32_01015 [Rubritalea profundi]